MSRFGFDQCERARVLAALAPDGELSELDRRRLRAHLRHCAACARFAHDVLHMSMLLREDELVRPSTMATVPHVVRRRRAVATRVRPVAAAAAVALMALGIANRAPLEMDAREPAARTAASSPGDVQRELDSIRAWRRTTRQIDVAPLERAAVMGRNQPV